MSPIGGEKQVLGVRCSVLGYGGNLARPQPGLPVLSVPIREIRGCRLRFVSRCSRISRCALCGVGINPGSPIRADPWHPWLPASLRGLCSLRCLCVRFDSGVGCRFSVVGVGVFSAGSPLRSALRPLRETLLSRSGTPRLSQPPGPLKGMGAASEGKRPKYSSFVWSG